MSNGEWLVIALACAVGVIGLLLAASDSGGTTFALGLGLFVVAVVYAFVFIKRHFDRAEQSGH